MRWDRIKEKQIKYKINEDKIKSFCVLFEVYDKTRQDKRRRDKTRRDIESEREGGRVGWEEWGRGWGIEEEWERKRVREW